MPVPVHQPVPSTTSPQEERLAVNLFDLNRVEPSLFRLLFAKRLELNKGKAIRVDPKVTTETALPFHCSLIEAATACDILRNENRKLKEPIARVYVNRGRGWVKLPSTVFLTLAMGESCILNPEVFGQAMSEELAGPIAPLRPKRIEGL